MTRGLTGSRRIAVFLSKTTRRILGVCNLCREIRHLANKGCHRLTASSGRGFSCPVANHLSLKGCSLLVISPTATGAISGVICKVTSALIAGTITRSNGNTIPICVMPISVRPNPVSAILPSGVRLSGYRDYSSYITTLTYRRNTVVPRRRVSLAGYVNYNLYEGAYPCSTVSRNGVVAVCVESVSVRGAHGLRDVSGVRVFRGPRRVLSGVWIVSCFWFWLVFFYF